MEGEEERSSSSSSSVLSSIEDDEEADVERSSTPSNVSDYADQQVMSEVHLGCPPFSSGPHISHFTFPCPPRFDAEGSTYDDSIEGRETSACQMVGMDEDGDLVLTRRLKPSNNCRMSIRHSISSSIPSVGLQVWKAELLLADFLLHSMFTSSDLDGIVALELGAGTGFSRSLYQGCLVYY